MLTSPLVHPWRPAGIALCMVLLTPAALADKITVFTDSHHTVQAPPNARIIALDEPAWIARELATNLPADPKRSAALVQQRLQTGGVALQRRIASAYQNVVDAWALGITTIPAVVVDQRYVVYGEPDVAKAVARIEAYRRKQP